MDQALKVHFDGGRRDSKASYGWVLYVSYDKQSGFDQNWFKLAASADVLGDVSSMCAELRGAVEAVQAATDFVERVRQNASM